MASHRSRRWKSGSAPLIFTASFHTTDCRPSFGFQWNFTNVDSSGGVDEPEGVDAEALHEPERAGDRPVRHRPHHHVGRLRHQRDEVPEVVVRRLGLREAPVRCLLDRVDEVGELDRVLDEEDRDVVADEIPVALLRVELHGEAAHVAGEVGRALVAGNGREAHEHRGALAGPLEQVGAGHVGERFVGLEEAVGAEAAGVDDALGDALVVEVEDLLAEVEVLEQRGPRSPTRNVFWSSATGTPCWVVRRARPAPATWWVSPPFAGAVDQVLDGDVVAGRRSPPPAWPLTSWPAWPGPAWGNAFVAAAFFVAIVVHSSLR